MFLRHGPDISEVFSQPRVVQEAALRNYDGVRLKPGWSLDLTRDDPETGEPWDLTKKAVRKRVKELVIKTKPFMVIGSPPCTIFSALQNLSKKKRKDGEFERLLEVGKKHMRFCLELYEIQRQAGRYFLHEHPESASSWRMDEVVEMLTKPGVDMATCDMCAYGMKIRDAEGVALARKRTRIMCNSPEVLKRLAKKCTNEDKDSTVPRHRHAETLNGGAKRCQVYPKAFCQAICAGVAAQKKLRNLGMDALELMSMEEMTEAIPGGSKTSDPMRELHDMEHEDSENMQFMEAYDDVTGVELDPKLMQKARCEEIEYFKEMQVYTKVDVEECWESTGKAPIPVRWVDINKGDSNNPLYRSRLVAKEYNTGVRPDLYAATPPTECLRLMLSRLASNKNFKLMYADVSRAYFYAKAVRPVYVKLPEEDLKPGDEGKCGKLLMSMYGTRDAAQNWSMEYADTLKRDGYIQGRANPCLFRHPESKVMIMVHGDDFVAIGTDKQLAKTKETLKNKYKIKVEELGRSEESKKEVKILNKIVRYTGDGIEFEADPRHAEMVVKDLGMENAKTSRVPGVKPPKTQAKERGHEQNDGEEIEKELEVIIEEEDEAEQDLIRDIQEIYYAHEADDQEDEDPLMEPADATRYRAVAARLNYLAVDRVDIQYAVKEAARNMSAPKDRDWTALGKIGRYLKFRPRLVVKFPWQAQQDKVVTFTDSDWAGCVKSAKSTSGGIVTIGDHTIKSYSRQQKVVALSSAEAELYAMVAASAETLAVIAYAKDLGFTMEGEVYTDSSAALGIAQRLGLGKVRHLRTQGLWIQEVRTAGRLAYHKVLGSKNPSDILTKHVPADLLTKHLETLGVEVQEGRSEVAPELNTMEVESWVTWLPAEGEHDEDGEGEAEGKGEKESGKVVSSSSSRKPKEERKEEGKEPGTKAHRRVRFARSVQFRAVPHENRGRRCSDRAAGWTCRMARVSGGVSTEPAKSWADLTDEEDETKVRAAASS